MLNQNVAAPPPVPPPPHLLLHFGSSSLGISDQERKREQGTELVHVHACLTFEHCLCVSAVLEELSQWMAVHT